MKKLFLSMLAAVTLFASCSQEEIVSQTGGESLVSFTVTTPELGSRAVNSVDGDGKQITDLYYAVYDETSKEIVTTISKTDKKETIAVGSTKNIELPLLNGHKYSLIFWAENEACPYTVDWEKKTIKLEDAASLKSNQENYDAFYAYFAPFVVTGHKSETVELKRPFAQLNIATSQGDLDRVVDYYGLDAIEKTKIVVKTPTVMDLVTGNTSNEKELTYALYDFGTLAPAANLFPAVIDEVKDKQYVAISLNYLLVSADKQLVDVKMSCDAGSQLDREFKNIPVQRNYRTNIYGNLYTSARDWNVDIKPGYDGTDFNHKVVEVETAEQLKSAVTDLDGGEIVLVNDITLDEPLTIGSASTGRSANDNNEAVFTLNLNGKTITTGEQETGRHHYAINNYVTLVIEGTGEINARGIQNFGTLTIDGDITITDIDTNGGAAIWNEGKVTINKGTFTTVDGSEGSKGGALQTRTNGVAIINGGTFIAKSQLTYAIINEGTTTINDATVKGKHGAVANDAGTTTIYNGTFEQTGVVGQSDHCIFNYKNEEGAVLTIHGGNFKIEDNADAGGKVFYDATIAEGHTSVAGENGWHHVVDGNTAVVKTLDDLKTAISEGKDIKLASDITTSEIIKIESPITIDLNGKTVTANCRKAFEVYVDVTIKNGTIVSQARCVDTRKNIELTLENVALKAEKYYTENQQPLTIGGNDNGTKVTMNNVTINAGNQGYGIISFVEANVIVTNSTISGYNALYVKPLAAGSTFNFVNSTLKGSTASNDVEGNSFTTIAVRDNNTTVYVDKDSKVIAEGNKCSVLSCGGSASGEESSTGSKITLAGSIEGDILGGKSLEGNEIYVNKAYKSAIESEGYTCVATENDLVQVTF